MIQITARALSPDQSNRSRHAEAIRQRRGWFGLFKSRVQDGAREGNRLQNPVKTPDRKHALQPADEKEKKQSAGALETIFHVAESDCPDF